MPERTEPVTIDKILVPTDFSELSLHALDYAASIAKAANAEIVLLHVFESYPTNTMLKMMVDFPDIMEKGIRDKMDEIKNSNPNLTNVRISSKVTTGKIYSEIDRVATEENIRLIVMGTHGVSGVGNIGKFIIGSNAYRTIQNAVCPVITITYDPWSDTIKNILLPLDSTKESEYKVELAIHWAKYFGATVHLLAITAFFENIFVRFSDIEAKVADTELMLEKAGVPYTSNIVRHNAPSESVMEHARRVNADLIMIVTGQEGYVNEMLFGSSARNIIGESRVPVLSINVR